MKARIDYFDFLKGSLICLVVWGHICSYVSGLDYEYNEVTRYVRLFQMPLFILVSGFFSKDIIVFSDLISKLVKDVKHIGLPLLTWCLLAFIVHSIMMHSYELPSKHFMSFLSAYWFFPCLLCCSFVWHTLSYIKNKNNALGISLIILSIISILFIPDYFYTSFLWIFYLLGVLTKNAYQYIHNWSNRGGYYAVDKIVARLLLYLFVIYTGYRFETRMTFYNQTNNILNDGVSLSHLFNGVLFVIKRYAVYISASLVALDAFWMLYKLIRKRCFSFYSHLLAVGKETLFIYVFHILILFFVVNPIIKKTTSNMGILTDYPFLRYYIVSTIICAAVIIVSMYLATKIKDKKYLSFILSGVTKTIYE